MKYQVSDLLFDICLCSKPIPLAEDKTFCKACSRIIDKKMIKWIKEYNSLIKRFPK